MVLTRHTLSVGPAKERLLYPKSGYGDDWTTMRMMRCDQMSHLGMQTSDDMIFFQFHTRQ